MPLENLPPEIRRQLLFILELEELRALVLASPVFHQQYLLDRKFLLCKSLEATLRSVTVDASAVCRTSFAACFSDICTGGKITQFLKSYQDRRSSTQYSILTDRLTEDEAVGMAAFHSSIIKPLARRYTDWALANLADETKNSRSQPLNKTEETRLLRALYRFQLCCNLFGNANYGAFWQPMLREILEMFLCIFEPWEVQEIACIYTFSKEKYNQIFNDIRWDVHKENPKFEGQRPPTPEGVFNLDHGC